MGGALGRSRQTPRAQLLSVQNRDLPFCPLFGLSASLFFLPGELIMATATCMQPLHLVETSRNAKSSGSMQSTNPDSHAYHHRDDRRASGSSQQSQQRQRPRTQGQASPATTHIVPRHEKQHRSRRHERPDRGNGGADTRRAAAAGGSEKREQHQQQAYRRNRCR